MADSFYKPPDVTVFVPCPNCSRLLEFHADHCPDCREEITDEYRLIAAVLTAAETQSCSLANTIRTADPVVVIFLAWDILAWLTGIGWMGLAFLLSALVLLGAIGLWYWRFGRFPFTSPDFIGARREMLRSLLFWLAFAFFQAIFVAYTWPFGQAQGTH